ncbi:MAG: class I SAM-dependent methyltransferase [Candidatus Omnitrophota bacterium]|nr:class I SAM-dependent methyltransferase [Candidatus Omnitrophota bacterium]
MENKYDRGGTQKESYLKSEVMNVDCPLCGADNCRKIYVERGSLGIVSCNNCGLIYVNPRLAHPEAIYSGNAEKYFQEARLIFEGKLPHHRDKNYRDDLKLIRRYKPAGNFLDVGTNMGFFLRNAKNWKGWEIYGVEPSVSLSEMARRYFGLNVKTAFLENAGFKADFFDIVTLTDVFEHIADPSVLLAEIKRVIKPDGVLFIKVPNGMFNIFKLRLAKLTGRLKKHDIFDSYEHVVHYSADTLKMMLEKAGFKVIKFKIGKPIQLPVWHNLVGYYYQYPSPWVLDCKRRLARDILYYLSKMEFYLCLKKVGFLAPNIIAVAKKSN